jgi:hypothetical protein
VSGKNNKILPIPETMQGISTSAESKEKRSKKKKKTPLRRAASKENKKRKIIPKQHKQEMKL